MSDEKQSFKPIHDILYILHILQDIWRDYPSDKPSYLNQGKVLLVGEKKKIIIERDQDTNISQVVSTIKFNGVSDKKGGDLYSGCGDSFYHTHDMSYDAQSGRSTDFYKYEAYEAQRDSVEWVKCNYGSLDPFPILCGYGFKVATMEEMKTEISFIEDYDQVKNKIYAV